MKNFEIDVIKLLQERAIAGPIIVSNGGSFSLVINDNYIQLDHKEREEFGSSHEAYSYHPEGSCEGKGICIWCGSTLFNLEID